MFKLKFKLEKENKNTPCEHWNNRCVVYPCPHTIYLVQIVNEKLKCKTEKSIKNKYNKLKTRSATKKPTQVSSSVNESEIKPVQTTEK